MMTSNAGNNASAMMIEGDRDSPGAARGSALSGNKTAPAFRHCGRAVVQRPPSINYATMQATTALAPSISAFTDEGYGSLATAELHILAEFLTALDQAKRTAKGPELIRIVAALRALRDSKIAAARATRLAQIKAGQGTALREAAGLQQRTKPATGAPNS